MLVLTRKPGEGVDIAEGLIKVSVLEVVGRQVKIGFSLPKEIVVLRNELLGTPRKESDDAN
jgi:carbon storage regulator CsrA